MRAVGDRAIEQTLDAMARAQREAPRPELRHRIEHCGICPPDLQTRVLAQGIVPAMQPAFFWEFGDGYLRNHGRERADTMFPVRSLLARRVAVVGSSDAPVTHWAPSSNPAGRNLQAFESAAPASLLSAPCVQAVLRQRGPSTRARPSAPGASGERRLPARTGLRGRVRAGAGVPGTGFDAPAFEQPEARNAP